MVKTILIWQFLSINQLIEQYEFFQNINVINQSINQQTTSLKAKWTKSF